MDQRLVAAQNLFSQQQYQRSNEICDTLLSEGIRQPELLHLKARNCVRFGQFAGATEFLHQSSVLCPTDEKVWLDIGYVQVQLNQIQLAKEAYQNAIRINHRSTLAYNGLAVIIAHEGNYETSIELLELALEINPEDENARINLSKLVEIGKSKKESQKRR